MNRPLLYSDWELGEKGMSSNLSESCITPAEYLDWVVIA